MAVKVTRNRMSPSLGRMQTKFDKLPKLAYQFWRRITPKRTGNAKRRTKLRGRIIDAAYNYAVPLDNGWSRQAPRGMSQPTEEYIKRRIKGKILRK